MNVKRLDAATANLTSRTLLTSGLALAASAMLLLAQAPAQAAPADKGGAAKEKPVTFEPVEGSTVKRIILSEKAVQRLGIELGKVDEGPIERKQVVGGIFLTPPAAPSGLVAAAPVTPAPSGGFAGVSFGASAAQRPIATPPALGDGLVRVMLSPQEWQRMAQEQPARIFKLAARGESKEGLTARPSKLPPVEDGKRSMLTYFLVIDGKDHGLTVNERVRVELPLANSGEKRRFVPYGAVYYDAKGGAWVYLNPKPQTYERKPVRVEYIVGDRAVLADGPAVGTPVVTVGTALLYGTEVYGK